MAYFCRKKTSRASAARAHYALRFIYWRNFKQIIGEKRRKIGELFHDNDLTIWCPLFLLKYIMRPLVARRTSLHSENVD